MAEADSRLIEWLFHNSGISRYKISKDVGISESTLSRIAKGETPMDAVRFGYARKLTDYARTMASQTENGKHTDTTPHSESNSNQPRGGDNT
ncbi:hypothetical protein HXA34_20570 [Salipaludibacillus agaradhaerens]|jgi:cytochrome c556|uniref:helix-turn-helix domain-containing protein n=1 Tax=Salipaludibacillus agaradhaerens TaxID=76935 RepID=UPI0021512D79|nr:helix-turn-helix transcriptional regulator [Salipaludibacillus agaradhaerens]MCR6108694.1 hypothetical protein [Salipaludibacillus agaradhaerens]MCR6120717.1 hypothetical protein [Salipaludibacillus agaradhaerens]